MTHARHTEPPLRRRSLLTGLVTAIPAAALAQSPAPAVSPEPKQPASPATPVAHPCQFLTDPERRTLEALTGRIIPADDLGPGAVEAGVVTFMDRQLAGAWGTGAHFYKSGPFAAGTPQQGYQLAMTPADLIREGIARLDAAAAAQHGKAFAACAPDDQEAMMKAMHDGKLDMGPVPSNVFFNTVVDFTMEGFFSDPLYGGNQDMVGWKLVGFPGAYDSYAQEIERHGLEWRRTPVPMSADLDLASLPGETPICETR